MKEHHRVTRDRIAALAARRLREVVVEIESDRKAAAQAAIRARLAAEIKQKIALKKGCK